MAISSFIPTVWSETLYSELNKEYVAVANCNRDFEGEIKEKGSKVRICGVTGVGVNDYISHNNLQETQELMDSYRDIEISQAKYFNFLIDDVERAQSMPRLMESAMNKAANALADEADRYVYTLFNQAGATITVDDVSGDSIIDAIISARTKLYENNVSATTEVVVEVPPKIAELILKAKINLSTDNGECLENGCIGRVAGCKIFVSNNIVKDTGYYKCFVRTKRAITFAEQLSEIEAYRPERRFADAVKGLHLFGAKVVYQKEFVVLNVKVA